jgi:hypothetical protein
VLGFFLGFGSVGDLIFLDTWTSLPGGTRMKTETGAKKEEEKSNYPLA